MHSTLAVSLLALGGLSHASFLNYRQAADTTTIRVFLDNMAMMSVDVDVPTDGTKQLSYNTFKAAMVRTSNDKVRCQILDLQGTIGVLEACEAQTFTQGVTNATIICDVPADVVPTTFTTFTVAPTPTADPTIQTATVEIDNDAIDLAQNIPIPVNQGPVPINQKVTDIVVNKVTGDSSKVQCQAWADAAATSPLGQPVKLNGESVLNNGQAADVSVITCFTLA